MVIAKMAMNVSSSEKTWPTKRLIACFFFKFEVKDEIQV